MQITLSLNGNSSLLVNKTHVPHDNGWVFLKSLSKEIFNLDFNFRKTLNCTIYFFGDLQAVSQARFRESLFFQLFVLRCKDWNSLHKDCHYFQAAEVSSMGMQACGLKGNLDCLKKIQQGRDNIVRVSWSGDGTKDWWISLKSPSLINKNIAASFIDKAWTGLYR